MRVCQGLCEKRGYLKAIKRNTKITFKNFFWCRHCGRAVPHEDAIRKKMLHCPCCGVILRLKQRNHAMRDIEVLTVNV